MTEPVIVASRNLTHARATVAALGEAGLVNGVRYARSVHALLGCLGACSQSLSRRPAAVIIDINLFRDHQAEILAGLHSMDMQNVPLCVLVTSHEEHAMITHGHFGQRVKCLDWPFTPQAMRHFVLVDVPHWPAAQIQWLRRAMNMLRKSSAKRAQRADADHHAGKNGGA